MDNIVTILPTNCVRFGHRETDFCIPQKTPCNNTVVDGIFVNCGEQWNCNKSCFHEMPYFMPVPHNGTFMIQTNFSSQGGTGGWGTWIYLNLIDHEGKVVEDYDHTNLTIKYMTGRSLKHQYQILEIDVSKIPIDCFGFMISSFGTQVCTQFYKKENCENLVEVEGVFNRFDCMNNYYGEPIGEYTGTSFQYSNKIYLNGMVKFFGGSTDEETSVKQIYRFHPSKKVPPFIMKYLLNKVIAADQLIVNGDQYSNSGSGNFSPVGNGISFFPIIEFYNDCISNSGCS